MADPDLKIWDGIMSHLRGQSPNLCRQWFNELEPLGVAGGQFVVRAQSDVHRDYLRRQCAEQFNDAAVTVSGRLVTVRFLGPQEEAPGTERPGDSAAAKIPALAPTPAQAAAGRDAGAEARHEQPVVRRAHPITYRPSTIDAQRRRDDSLVINPDYAFENFVVGPENRLAHAAAMAVGKDPGHAYNPLFIHGGVGLGKTHLLQAICLRIIETNPGVVLYYLSCESFVTQFIDAVQAGEMSDFRHRFRDVDVLVIDDIHFLTKREQSQEEFFHTFNTLYQSNRQIVLSSDAPPEEIPDLEDRLVSRFKWGLVAKVDPPCYETRVSILKTKGRLRGIDLADDVACYIAAKIDTNIRELEGAITKVQIHASVENRPIDLDLAKSALGHTLPRSSGGPSIQTILNTVTEYFRVRITDVQSKRRQRSIAMPRQVCMYLARKLTRHSLEEIGGYFGGRDHTTVMHAIRIVELRMTKDPEFGATVNGFEEKLRPAKA